MPTPIRDKIVSNAAPHLRPGEQVQGAFAGQSISGWWFLLTYLMFFRLRYRAVIVTDQRILMLDTGKWSMTKPKGVVAELPRNVVIGPAKGLWWKCLTLGEKLFVHRRFHKDVLAADTLLAGSGQPVQQIPLGGHRQRQGPPAGQAYGAAQVQPSAYGAPQVQPSAYGAPQVQPSAWQPDPRAPQSHQQTPQGRPQQWQPDPHTPPAPQQAAQQAWPAANPQDPGSAEPDEDNRTRIRPAAPRPDQPRPDQAPRSQDRPEP